MEITGAVAGALDKFVVATGSSTAANSGNTATLSQPNDFVIGVISEIGDGVIGTISTGYTSLTQVSDTIASHTVATRVGYKTLSATTTAQAASSTLGTSAEWIATTVTISAGVATGTGSYTFTGVAAGILTTYGTGVGSYTFTGTATGSSYRPGYPNLVQTTDGALGDTTSVTVPLSSSTAAGDLLTVAIATTVPVESITDSIGSRWIQIGYSYPSNMIVGCELWAARGISGGSASVTITCATAAYAAINVTEWSGLWYVDPLDQWSQNFGTSESIIPQTVQPRADRDLVISVGTTDSVTIGLPTGGFTALPMPGANTVAAYSVLSGSVASAMDWGMGSSQAWAAVEACFVAGVAGLNPEFQFPETLVEISTTNNFLAPLEGTGVWTNASSYMRSMTLGPLGRQHELDRVQAASAQIIANNRDGSFNTWNTSSYLYNNGLGLKPMNPVKVTAAWDGVTSPQYYGYIQAVVPQITDALNVDAEITCVDIFQMLSLQYLANNNYAQSVLSNGPVAYYRLGDQPATYTTLDSSGNGYTGSLISGISGTPAYGSAGAMLYDPNTALDCTNGTNGPNGGFCTIDNTTQPPTIHNPLQSATNWSFECLLKWTQTAAVTDGGVGTVFYATAASGEQIAIQVGQGLVSVANPSGASVSAVNTFNDAFILSPGWCGNGWEASTSYSTGTLICPSGASGFLFYMDVTTGSSGSSQPVWNTTIGAITTDGAIQWLCFSNFSAIVPNTVLMDGGWHHLVVVYDDSLNAVVPVVDGVELNLGAFVTLTGSSPYGIQIGIESATTSAESLVPTILGTWKFGQPAADGVLTGGAVESLLQAEETNGFPGVIDEVALYDTLMTGTQIISDYHTFTWFQTQEFGASVGGPLAGRFNKVLQVAKLNPSTILNVPYQFRTLLYAEQDAVTTTSALNYLQTQTESEPGLIFQAPNGMINAYSRQYQYLNPTSIVSQGIFGDTSAAAYRFDGPSLQITSDDLDTWNDIEVQSGIPATATTGQVEIGVLQEWGPAQSAAAAQSASVYGGRTLQGLTSLQMAYNSDALSIAQNYFNWYGVPIQRVTQLTLNSQGNSGNNISQMLQRGLYDRLTVQYQGQTPGSVFAQDALVEQIQHTVDMSGPTWTTVFSLSPYEILLEPTILGTWRFGESASEAVLTL
jgi:hypothetical protein